MEDKKLLKKVTNISVQECMLIVFAYKQEGVKVDISVDFDGDCWLEERC